MKKYIYCLLLIANCLLANAQDLDNASQIGQITRNQEVWGLQVNDSTLLKGIVLFINIEGDSSTTVSFSPDAIHLTNYHRTATNTGSYFEIKNGLAQMGSITESLDSTNNLTVDTNKFYWVYKGITQYSFPQQKASSAKRVLTDVSATGALTWENVAFATGDSVTIYALTPAAGSVYYCTNCTGSGITGRIVSYFGAAWRRLLFD